MRTFIENCLHFMKNCIRPHYEKLKPLKSGFIENLIFENNRDPCTEHSTCSRTVKHFQELAEQLQNLFRYVIFTTRLHHLGLASQAANPRELHTAVPLGQDPKADNCSLFSQI